MRRRSTSVFPRTWNIPIATSTIRCWIWANATSASAWVRRWTGSMPRTRRVRPGSARAAMRRRRVSIFSGAWLSWLPGLEFLLAHPSLLATDAFACVRCGLNRRVINSAHPERSPSPACHPR
ncbi:hypothetical protein [Lysobacter gummosus]|uniref:hypothetical protein n=1 Tax=Lysobacter gummosus TaxID=262324 RepID=UPI00363ACDC7